MTSDDGSAHGDLTIFCLHHLGGSAREWSRVAASVRHARVVPLDLPGFGDEAGASDFTVAEMASAIEARIRATAAVRWILAGHSMGAKVAAAIARRVEDGTTALDGLAGLVLLAGSPPGPEPMDDAGRETMLAAFRGDDAASRADAEAYVDRNAGDALDAEGRALAVADAMRQNRAAWRAWLERGSREDWSDRIGVLRMPALALAGADDENLGPKAQRAFVAPHFADFELQTFANTKHLLPLERPHEVAIAIERFVRVSRRGAPPHRRFRPPTGRSSIRRVSV